MMETCEICNHFVCDDPACEGYCCQGHCKECGLSITAMRCKEDSCDDHCRCGKEESN